MTIRSNLACMVPAIFICVILSACHDDSSSTSASGTTAAKTPATSTSGSPVTTTGTTSSIGPGGLLEFSESSYSIAQSAGRVNVIVTRRLSSSGATSVHFATVDGTAIAGTNYTAANGTLNWASGDTSAKMVSISVEAAPRFTGAKSFSVALSAETGVSANVGATQATVTISGSEAAITAGAMGQAAAARLLMQATFGATMPDLNSAAGQSYDSWFAAQAAAKPSLNAPALVPNQVWSASWLHNAVLGNDQLRQRMAYALSQILVVSGNGGPLVGHWTGLAHYYDLLVNNALGNYRTLLEQVTLSTAMGEFLSMQRNDKANPATGVHADQNYAREVMQLFTVGLVKLNIDGSVQVDGSNNPLPNYGGAEVENLSNVFTGWSSQPTTTTGNAETNWLYALDETRPMMAYEAHHDTTAKTLIGGVQVPAGGSAAADLKIALDTLFNHPNVGPFLSKQLIQRLVTSNPSPGYVQRVATVFNNDGSGVRGNLLAVAKAILTDPEALSVGGDTYGKLREPMLRLTNLWRAFDASNSLGQLNEGMIVDQGINYFGEYPLQSPTVFNFFRPDFELAGPLTAAGMVVPEFQITNESTLVQTANWLEIQSYQYSVAAGGAHMGVDNSAATVQGFPTATSVYLHTAAWDALAADPASLVDEMNLVFMAGQMPAALRTVLINYATALPASPAAARVAETAELLINSPQYAVQR